MILLYRFFSSIVYFLCRPFWYRKASRGDISWRERLAINLPQKKVDVWLHAASVGEVRLISSLVAYLKKKRSDLRIHISVMTPLGRKTAQDLWGGEVSISYFPLDVHEVWNSFFAALDPRVIIVAEAELWPRLLDQIRLRGIPILLANARMSDKSFHRYMKLRGSVAYLLGAYERLFYKSSKEALRYESLGAPPERGEIAGDLKFDAPLFRLSPDRMKEIRKILGVGDGEYIFTAGSTRKIEPEIILNAFIRSRKEVPGLILVLAPRHLDRCSSVIALLENRNLSYRLWSACVADANNTDANIAHTENLASENQVMLVDVMGVLQEIFAVSDLAFVGGTMSDTGGHNLLEPVWAGTPVLFGPDTRSVPDLAEYILKGNFGARIKDGEDLSRTIIDAALGRKTYSTKKDVSKIDQTSASFRIGNYALNLLEASKGGA